MGQPYGDIRLRPSNVGLKHGDCSNSSLPGADIRNRTSPKQTIISSFRSTSINTWYGQAAERARTGSGSGPVLPGYGALLASVVTGVIFSERMNLLPVSDSGRAFGGR